MNLYNGSSSSETEDAHGILQNFKIDSKLGFLFESIDQLPAEFRPWEALAESLTSLLSVGGVRAAVSKMPLLDTSNIEDEFLKLSRAKLLLSTITQSYVFGQPDTATSLPPQLSVPLCRISELLGVPPIMNYADYVLGNWQLINTDAPVSLENIQIKIGMNGGVDEAWFILVHVAVELEAGKIVANCVEAKLASEIGDTKKLIEILNQLTELLGQLKKTFLRMRERCDPHVYFLRVRPFTHGWHNNPAFDGGLIYEGVSQHAGEPKSFRGETGAQSSVVPCVDSVLGIQHPDDKLNEHLIAMRDYMPLEHRQFLDWMAASEVRNIVKSADDETGTEGAGSELLNSYNRCCEALTDFRTTHMEIAHQYVYAHKGAEIDSESNSASVGTGGTPPMDYLRHHRDATGKSAIGAEE